MKIKKIRLCDGYKRFFDLTIDLGTSPKKIIALVGPNGSGKSSVFDGMIFRSSTWAVIGNTGSKNKSFHSMNNVDITAECISITYDTNENHAQLRERFQNEGRGNTIYNYRNAYRHHGELNVAQLKAVEEITANNVGASSSVDLDNKVIENYQRLYTYINTYRKVNDLTDTQANIAVIGELNDILGECLGLTLSDHGDIQSGRGTLYFTKPNQANPFPFNVLSSGEKEVVDIILDIFLKREKFNSTIFLIDEPELHLNTAIQKKLLLALDRLIPDTCQLWVATHSIGFLNALQTDLKDKSDIINFEGDFSSSVQTLEPMKKTRANWQRILKTALDDLTGLVSPSTIVYCEGRLDPGKKGEEQGLDAEVYNQIFSETYPDCLFVSSGGQTQPDKYATIALSVLNKAFSGVTILLLKDKDINTDKTPTTDKQREGFLAANPSMHRMLERKEIENYLFDYEIVSKAYTISQEDYAKAIPDINGEAKDFSFKLLTQLGITTGMNRDDLKKRLSTFVTPDTKIFTELHNTIFN